MKNIIIKKNIYLLFVMLGAGLFSACNENIHDFAKKTPADATHTVYIADSVFNYTLNRSANAEYTGVDTILVKFPVYSNIAVDNDVTVRLAVDYELVNVYNIQHGTGYKELPVYLMDRSVLTIPKGQTQSVDSLSLSYPRVLFPFLYDTAGYLLPVRITSYRGTDVKINYEERVAYIKINVIQQNGVFFENTQNSSKIENNPALDVFDNNLTNIEFNLYSIFETTEETTVRLSVNNNLIPEYNKKMKTNYQAVPESDFDPMEIIIPAGAKNAKGIVSYKGDISTLTDMNSYVVPFEITSVSGTDIGRVDAQRVFYAIVFNSNLHCDYVDSDSELGTKVTDRSKYKAIRFANAAGSEIANIPDAYKNRIFDGDDNTNYFIPGLASLTIDLGEDVTNITGFYIPITANNIIKNIDLRCATQLQYEAAQDNLIGKIRENDGVQYLYIKISEPITARYIKLDNMLPVPPRLTEFYIYTSE